jgi:hypothetical protein
MGQDVQLSVINLRDEDSNRLVAEAVAVSYVLDMDSVRRSSAVSLLYDSDTGIYRGQIRAAETAALTENDWYWIEIMVGHGLSHLYYRIRRRAVYRDHRSTREGYDYLL